jgi:hypothetical protein
MGFPYESYDNTPVFVRNAAGREARSYETYENCTVCTECARVLYRIRGWVEEVCTDCTEGRASGWPARWGKPVLTGLREGWWSGIGLRETMGGQMVGLDGGVKRQVSGPKRPFGLPLEIVNACVPSTTCELTYLGRRTHPSLMTTGSDLAVIAPRVKVNRTCRDVIAIRDRQIRLLGS